MKLQVGIHAKHSKIVVHGHRKRGKMEKEREGRRRAEGEWESV